MNVRQLIVLIVVSSSLYADTVPAGMPSRIASEAEVIVSGTPCVLIASDLPTVITSEAEAIQAIDRKSPIIAPEVFLKLEPKEIERRFLTLPEGVSCSIMAARNPSLYDDSSEWLKLLFGATEEVLLTQYSKVVAVDPLPSMTLGDIDDLYVREFGPVCSKSTSGAAASEGAVAVIAAETQESDLASRSAAEQKSGDLVHVGPTGLDALEFLRGATSSSAVAPGAVVQVASQFNALESMDPHSVAPLSCYPFDHTQGPRAAMPAAHALLLRQAMAGCYNAFQDLPLLHEAAPCGYLLWGNDTEKCEAFTALLRDQVHLRKVRIMAQWVRPEAWGASTELPLLQVFTAAPPTHSYGNCGGTELATLLVTAQYKAIAQLSALLAKYRGASVPLELTQVGQGVFGNEVSVLRSAMKAVADVLSQARRQGVVVVTTLHAHGKNDQLRAREILDAIDSPSRSSR